MFPLVIGAEVRRIVLNHYNIRGQSDARVCALDQVVTQQSIAGKASVQNAEHGIDFVDALPRECAFSIQILVDIGNRPRVGIETGLAGKNGRQPRARARLHTYADSGL